MVLNGWARWALVTIPRFCVLFLHFAILKVNANMKFAKCRGHFRHFPRTHIKKCFDLTNMPRDKGLIKRRKPSSN